MKQTLVEIFISTIPRIHRSVLRRDKTLLIFKLLQMQCSKGIPSKQ